MHGRIVFLCCLNPSFNLANRRALKVLWPWWHVSAVNVCIEYHVHTERNVVYDVVYAPADTFVVELMVFQLLLQFIDTDSGGHRTMFVFQKVKLFNYEPWVALAETVPEDSRNFIHKLPTTVDL